ncbi:uncharacterized protein [Malus domestica]|uniref:uncharacterized protein n=1 Tax=Malus domestica TaxID=3750 RepID=UPI00397703C6
MTDVEVFGPRCGDETVVGQQMGLVEQHLIGSPVQRQRLTGVNPTESNKLFKLELTGAWEPPGSSCASTAIDSRDFNEILQAHEQEGGNIRHDRQMEGFRGAVEQCRLVDLGFTGNKFTWFTTRGGGIKVRLDRALVVQDGWNHEVAGSPVFQVTEKIKMTRMKLTNWAWNNARAEPKEIREVEDKLTSLLGQPFTDESIEQKKKLIRKLNRLLEQDEQFWRQRSKENWVKLRDRNTKYFHQKANKRQKLNCLYGLMDDNACWHDDRRGMEEIVVSYFTQLFRSSGGENFGDILCHISPKVTDEMNSSLLSPFMDEEIKCAVFQMHPTKVPGPDGAKSSKIEKEEICIHSTHKQVEAYSSAGYITQSAFIPGSLISDNYLVAAEVAHYIHKRSSGLNGLMALKLDMSKAYDRVEWKFLEAVMQSLGFADRCIRMVMCTQKEEYVKGVLSPPSYLCCVQKAYRLFLSKAKWEGKLHGIKVCRAAFSIHHLFFTDDCFLFTRGTIREVIADSLGMREELNMMIAKFWWSGDSGKRKIRWLSWRVLYFLEARVTSNSLYVWRSIAISRLMLHKGLRWQEEVELIRGIPLSVLDIGDCKVWHYDRHGRFTVRNAYHVARVIPTASREWAAGSHSYTSNGGEKLWNKLWTAGVPGKVKICVWRACLDSLPTRLNLCKRRVPVEDGCVVCGCQVESVEHILRHCHVARAVWFRGLGLRVDTGHGVSLLNWLANMQLQGSADGFELGLMLIWSLWKHRNEVLWNAGPIDSSMSALHAEFLAARHAEQLVKGIYSVDV